MEKNEDECKHQLCNNLELYIGRKVKTPKDFEYLSQMIFTQTHQQVSATTLKRLWGYLNETTHTRISTLDVLSRFLGYIDWYDFNKTHTTFNPNYQEGEIDKNKLDWKTINPGERIEIEWMPLSKCTMEYIGNKTFRILSSNNTKLKPGDAIKCIYIIDKEPLYIINSTIGNQLHDLYCLGKTGGVTFRKITNKTKE